MNRGNPRANCARRGRTTLNRNNPIQQDVSRVLSEGTMIKVGKFRAKSVTQASIPINWGKPRAGRAKLARTIPKLAEVLRAIVHRVNRGLQMV